MANPPLLWIFIAVLSVGIFLAIRFGVAGWHGGTVERDTHPRLFWGAVGLAVVINVVLLIMGLQDDLI